MNTNQKKWLITAGVFAAAVIMSVLIGLLINRMTGSKLPDESGEPEIAASDQTETDEAVPSDETPSDESPADETPAESDAEPAETESAEETASASEGAEETEASTEPAPEETAAPAVQPVNIHQLSAEEIAEIRANFRDTEQYFYAGGERDPATNRAGSCITRNQILNDAIGNVTVFGPDSEQPTIYFTFILTTEYAPNTTDLLDTLAAHGIKAVFFTDSPYAQKYPEIIQRIIAEGHELGSMGASLPDGGIAKLSLEEMTADIQSFHNYIHDTYGYDMRKFYFSYDFYTDQAVAAVVRMGYNVVFYSANYEDYDHNKSIDLNNFLTSLSYQLHPGCIYSLHVTNHASVDVIPMIMSFAQQHGYVAGQLP